MRWVLTMVPFCSAIFATVADAGMIILNQQRAVSAGGLVRRLSDSEWDERHDNDATVKPGNFDPSAGIDIDYPIAGANFGHAHGAAIQQSFIGPGDFNGRFDVEASASFDDEPPVDAHAEGGGQAQLYVVFSITSVDTYRLVGQLLGSDPRFNYVRLFAGRDIMYQFNAGDSTNGLFNQTWALGPGDYTFVINSYAFATTNDSVGAGAVASSNFALRAVPEPASISLMGLGAAVIAIARWRRSTPALLGLFRR